jgi:hypothetical protein
MDRVVANLGHVVRWEAGTVAKSDDYPTYNIPKGTTVYPLRAHYFPKNFPYFAHTDYILFQDPFGGWKYYVLGYPINESWSDAVKTDEQRADMLSYWKTLDSMLLVTQPPCPPEMSNAIQRRILRGAAQAPAGTRFGGDITVEVTVDDGKIAEVNVTGTTGTDSANVESYIKNTWVPNPTYSGTYKTTFHY